MKDAKAPSTGSTMRQASRLGRIVRGVFATRGASGDAEGSGAPPVRPLGLLLCALALLASLIVGVALADAASAPGVFASTYTPDPEGGDHAVTLRGYVNRNGEEVTSCKFEYGLTSAYGETAPCAGVDEVQTVTISASAGQFRLTFGGHTTADIAFDASAEVVQERLQALASIGSGNVRVGGGPGNESGNSPYKVTFVGALAEEDVEQISAEDGTEPLSGGSGAATSTATPGFQTGVEYLNSTGGGAIPVSAHLSALDPSATYHYALIAGDAGGTNETAAATFETLAEEEGGACPNEARRVEQHSTFLPDCRAYEQVSPPAKNGADILANSARTRVATDGDAAVFSSLGAFGDAAGTGVATDYMALRGPAGWATHAITPSQEQITNFAVAKGGDPLYEDEFSPDLSKGIFRAWSEIPNTPFAPNVKNVENLYLRTDLRTPGAGAYQLLSNAAAPINFGYPLLDSFLAQVAGATADFSHILFESRYSLTAGTAGFSPRVYEWNNGSLSLVGEIPRPGRIECGGETACEAAFTSVAGAGVVFRTYASHAISADGSKVFFTVGGEEGGNLYMREDGTHTVQLNVSEREPCLAEPEAEACQPQPATYQNASADGSRVFFTSQQALTEDAPENGDHKLYMYDTTKPAFDPHNLTLLSVDSEPENGADVEGVLSASADGRYVYFEAIGQLVASLPSPAAFGPLYGVYLWHDGVVSYVGGIYVTDKASVNGGAADLPIDFQSTPLQPRVGADGDLLFMSTNGVGLTGYDHGTCASNLPGSGCTELYLYSPADGRLSCVSCNPSGAPATANAASSTRAHGGGSSTTKTLNRSFSADGRRVFFTTAEALVPRDTNGVKDAYEYDTATGAVHLLSSGTDPSDSYFMNASPSGNDVFILTRQRLVGWDTDNAYDLYDVRSAGGFPEPPPAPAPCGEDTCHEAVPPPALQPSPGSASAAGPGNPPIHRPCPKRKVKRRGKCVKPHHHRRHRANANRGASR